MWQANNINGLAIKIQHIDPYNLNWKNRFARWIEKVTYQKIMRNATNTYKDIKGNKWNSEKLSKALIKKKVYCN